VSAEIESVARDPRCWPAFVLSVTEGATALLFLSAAARALPGLLDGAGAPAFDSLLELPGFVDAWRACDEADLRRALGFRLALLGRIDGLDVDPTTASEVAEQFVRESWSTTTQMLGAAAHIYGDRFREVLAAAVRAHAPPIAGRVVRFALGDDPEERVELALRSGGETLTVLDALDDVATWEALARRARILAQGTADPWVAYASLAVFLRLARSGRDAPPGLVAPWALRFSNDYPEERSPLVVEALERLPDEPRAQLLAASEPFAWQYAALSRDARVLKAATFALDSTSKSLSTAWAIRAFHAWGAEGRRALAASPSALAREVEEALDAFATRRPVERRIQVESAALRRAIAQALDALDSDPAAWPCRRLQFPLLAFGDSPAEEPATVMTCSWDAVERFASFGLPSAILVSKIREVTRGGLVEATSRSSDPDPAGDRRLARLLVALGRMVLPAWDAVHPQDDRPHRVLDDAENVLSGGSARRTDDRRALHHEASDDTKTADRAHRDAYGAARVAVWAHTESLGDGENDEQDTPPDLAVWSFASIPTHGPTRSARQRAFWERFLLEVIPSVAVEPAPRAVM
jgi:hypothetical protein